MKKLLTTLLLILPIIVYSQTILSWNIQYLGEKKFKADTIIPVIGNVLLESKADIIAIQEVVLNSYGDSCIIQLASILNYNYVISKRTSGPGSERYAYLYHKSIKMNYNKLDIDLADSINREPYVASFTYNNNEVLIRQVHIVPTSKNPQYEISKLYNYTDGILCGDFNLTNEHLVFIPLLTNYKTPLKGQLTSLKNNGSLNKSYDHFFISKTLKYNTAFVFNYNYTYNKCKISDHLPVILKI